MKIVPASSIDMSKPLAMGGTSSVFRVHGEPAIVAKVYNDRKKIAVEKLKRLQTIDFGEYRQMLGVPFSLVSQDGAIIGFTQSYFEREQYITLDNWIEQPLAVRLDGKLRNLRFILKILQSLADVIDALHARHVCLVDLKPANVLVNKIDSTVRIIDCDSFCILDNSDNIIFPAKEVTLGYFAPDSLKAGKQISELKYSQDNYAYGVIAFQILNNGLHPYQGVWRRELPDYNLETLSTQGIFPYARVSSPEVSPLSMSVHDTFPDPLRTLFDRTFVPGLPRVTVRNWRNVLQAIDSSVLVEDCTKSGHAKFKDYPCAVCRHEDRVGPTKPQKKTPKYSSAPPKVKQSQTPGSPVPPPIQSPSVGINKAGRFAIWAVVGLFLAGFIIDEYNPGLLRGLQDFSQTNSAPSVAPTPQVQPPPPAASPLQFTPYGNRDIVGNDIFRGSVSNSDECQSLCVARTNCVAYVFDKWNKYCVLKATAQILKGEPKADAYVMNKLTPPEAKTPFSANPIYGKRFNAIPLEVKILNSSDECIALCDSNEKCWGINFISSRARCELLNQIDEAYIDDPNSMVAIFRQ
jgi:serine/threonine protein kinase